MPAPLLMGITLPRPGQRGGMKRKSKGDTSKKVVEARAVVSGMTLENEECCTVKTEGL